MAAGIVIRVAPQSLLDLANEIRNSHHVRLNEDPPAQILWLLTSAKPTRQGRVVISVSKKLAPEARFLSSGLDSVDAGYDYIVTLVESQWRSLTVEQQKAALDHALCSMVRKEKVNRRTGKVTISYGTRGPDVAEFTEVIQRHGLWNRSVRKLVEAGAQMALPMETVHHEPIRTTTVDANGLVVSTELEEPEHNGHEPAEPVNIARGRRRRGTRSSEQVNG